MKRILSFICTAAILALTVTFPAFAKTSGNLYGDANGDGEIDLKDILALKQYIAELSPKNFSVANANVNANKPQR